MLKQLGIVPYCGSILLKRKNDSEQEALNLQCSMENNKQCSMGGDLYLKLHHPFDNIHTIPKIANFERPAGDSWSLSFID